MKLEEVAKDWKDQFVLSDREAEVIGLRDDKKMKWKDIAQRFGVSDTRATHIYYHGHRKIIEKQRREEARKETDRLRAEYEKDLHRQKDDAKYRAYMYGEKA